MPAHRRTKERPMSTETTAAPRLDLRDGNSIPHLGLGTWPMDPDQAEEAVDTAIALGYRLIDTAARYGNEVGVGRGIARAGVPREELFVTTKLRGPSTVTRPRSRA